MSNKRRTIGLVTFLIAVIGGAGFAGWYFIWREKPSNGENPFLALPIQINEVMYIGNNVSQEWVELYYFGNDSLNLQDLQLKISTDKVFSLPDFQVHEYDYIAIHCGQRSSWAAPINQTTNSIDFFLEEMVEILPDSEGEVVLITNSGEVVDSIGWGSNTNQVNIPYWSLVNDSLQVDQETKNESLAIWGYNQNTSANWFVSLPTPALPNKFIYLVEGTNQTVIIQNGQITADYNNSEYYFIGKKATNKKGHPTPKPIKDQIKEAATYSVDFYYKLGYGYPKTGGDNIVNIKFSNTTDNESSGECDPETGDITIKVGKKATKASLKYVVEHELFHAVQMKLKNDICHRNQIDEWWFDEGMAVWFGMQSTMANYKMNMTQLMDEFKKVVEHNWHENAKIISDHPFQGWDYDDADWDDYIASFFLIKFIKEKYGEDKLKQIHFAIEQYKNFTQKVTAKQAIEKILGKKFEDILEEMNVWRVTEAPKANGSPQVSPDEKFTHKDDNPIDELEMISSLTASLEEIDCTQATDGFLVIVDSELKLKVTILLHHKNGTVEQKKVEITPPTTNSVSILVDPAKTSKVQLIKFNPNPENGTWINLTTVPLYGYNTVYFTEFNVKSENINDKYVEIYNSGNESIEMINWMFSLPIPSGLVFPLPNVTLDPEQYLCLFWHDPPVNFEIENTSSSKFLFLHAPENLDENIGCIKLLNAEGWEIDQFIWGENVPLEQISEYGWDPEFGTPYCVEVDHSLSLIGEDLNSAENWFETYPTPGLPNSILPYDASLFIFGYSHTLLW